MMNVTAAINAMTVNHLNRNRSSDKNYTASVSRKGELRCFAICSQRLHSLLHTVTRCGISSHVCKRPNLMLFADAQVQS